MSKLACLPDIPAKRYFTIGETAKLCALEPHVLRYWEQEFSILKPNKRRGGRRYYQAKDITLIRKISHLLYEKGFTINGARKQLSIKAVRSAPVPTVAAKPSAPSFAVTKVIKELESLLETLTGPVAS
jgi:DNA-binding transcriptional MerR regulator